MARPSTLEAPPPPRARAAASAKVLAWRLLRCRRSYGNHESGQSRLRVPSRAFRGFVSDPSPNAVLEISSCRVLGRPAPPLPPPRCPLTFPPPPPPTLAPGTDLSLWQFVWGPDRFWFGAPQTKTPKQKTRSAESLPRSTRGRSPTHPATPQRRAGPARPRLPPGSNPPPRRTQAAPHPPTPPRPPGRAGRRAKKDPEREPPGPPARGGAPPRPPPKPRPRRGGLKRRRRKGPARRRRGP